MGNKRNHKPKVIDEDAMERFNLAIEFERIHGKIDGRHQVAGGGIVERDEHKIIMRKVSDSAFEYLYNEVLREKGRGTQ